MRDITKKLEAIFVQISKLRRNGSTTFMMRGLDERSRFILVVTNRIEGQKIIDKHIKPTSKQLPQGIKIMDYEGATGNRHDGYALPLIFDNYFVISVLEDAIEGLTAKQRVIEDLFTKRDSISNLLVKLKTTMPAQYTRNIYSNQQGWLVPGNNKRIDWEEIDRRIIKAAIKSIEDTYSYLSEQKRTRHNNVALRSIRYGRIKYKK